MSPKDILNHISKAKSGDNSSFGILYNEFYKPVLRFAMFKTGNNKQLSEDIVSETFLKWFESLEIYEVRSKPLNYLFLIANRLIINQANRKKTESTDEEDFIDVKDEYENTEEILNTSLEFEFIQSLINKHLNEIEREILYLKYKEDKGNAEIAEILNKNENNIRQIEYRALQKVRSIIKQKTYENHN